MTDADVDAESVDAEENDASVETTATNAAPDDVTCIYCGGVLTKLGDVEHGDTFTCESCPEMADDEPDPVIEVRECRQTGNLKTVPVDDWRDTPSEASRP